MKWLKDLFKVTDRDYVRLENGSLMYITKRGGFGLDLTDEKTLENINKSHKEFHEKWDSLFVYKDGEYVLRNKQ